MASCADSDTMDGVAAPRSDVDCKVVLVGDCKCGKTSLVRRFVHDHFIEEYTPTGFDKYTCTYTVGDYRVHFVVWDTSGTVAYDTVRPLAYQDARVFLLCFTVCDPQSLDSAVNKWYPEIRQHCDSAPVILCACQADLRSDMARQRRTPVTAEQALTVSRQVGATTYVETSALWCGRAVREAFEVAALAALGKLNKGQRAKGAPCGAPRSRSKLDLKAELKDRAKSCSVM